MVVMGIELRLKNCSPLLFDYRPLKRRKRAISRPSPIQKALSLGNLIGLIFWASGGRPIFLLKRKERLAFFMQYKFQPRDKGHK
jgi:hypothetical protein